MTFFLGGSASITLWGAGASWARMMVAHPFESAAITRYPNRASWDAVSVDLLASIIDRWNLALGPVFSAGFAATAMAVADVHGGAPTLVEDGGHDGGARTVLVHGDFKPGNSMRSDTGWLAIVDVCAGRAIR